MVKLLCNINSKEDLDYSVLFIYILVWTITTDPFGSLLPAPTFSRSGTRLSPRKRETGGITTPHARWISTLMAVRTGLPSSSRCTVCPIPSTCTVADQTRLALASASLSMRSSTALAAGVPANGLGQSHALGVDKMTDLGKQRR